MTTDTTRRRVGCSLRFRRWDERNHRRQPFFIRQALDTERWTADSVVRLTGPENADVCIVGGGFTGLWTALRLKQRDPGLSVILLEADLCGTGASGRNGGAVVGWWTRLPTLARLVGVAAAAELITASVRAIDEIAAFSRAYDDQPHFARDGSFWVATNPSQVDGWRPTLRILAHSSLESPFAVPDDDRLVQSIGGSPHLQGVLDTTAGAVQPALLARCLLREARAHGVSVFEESPVRAIESGSDATPVQVQTERGSVRANQVVLAMNAWMANLPAFRKRVFVVSSDVVLTEPVDRYLSQLEWPAQLQVHNIDVMPKYYGPTWDKRLLLGRGGGTLAFRNHVSDNLLQNSRQKQEVTEEMRRLLPWTKGAKVDNAWSGPVDRCVATVPEFGSMDEDERIKYVIGYSGTGVAPTVIGGQILASMILGRDDEWRHIGTILAAANAAAGTVPGEPLRFVGGRIVQRAVKRTEEAQNAQRDPRKLDKFLASKVPSVKPYSTPVNSQDR